MLPSTEFAMLHAIAAAQSEHRVPSIAAAVVRHNTVLWTGTRGLVDGQPPTIDTQYRIGSITKSFVAVLVMRLRDEGKLDLNDRLDTHLPGTTLGDVTISQLLSHTSGLTAESPGRWWERTVGGDWPALDASITDGERKLRASARFHYSNTGYGVLGELVARMRGMSWLDALRAEILEPLELTRTTPSPQTPHALGWAVHPYADVLLPEPAEDAGAMAPAGQLWSTLTDQARWAAFVGGDSGEVLHPDTVAEMREPATVDDADNWTGGYGLGFQLMREGGRRLAGHTGSMPGFLATVLVDQKTRTGAVVMANTTSGPAIGKLVIDLIGFADKYEPALPAQWQPSAVSDELLALTGSWHWGPTPHVLHALPEGCLDLKPATGRGRASRFRPDGNGGWLGLDGYYAGETLRVVRANDGSVSHLDLATFIFTRRPYEPVAPIPGGVDEAGWRAV